MPRPRRLGPDPIGSALAGAFQQLGGAYAGRIAEGRRRDRAGEILEELDSQVQDTAKVQPSGPGGRIQPGDPIKGGVEKAPLFSRANAAQLAELQRKDPGLYDVLTKLDAYERSQQPKYTQTVFQGKQQTWEHRPNQMPKLVRERGGAGYGKVREMSRETIEAPDGSAYEIRTYGSDEKGIVRTDKIHLRGAKDTPQERAIQKVLNTANKLGQKKARLFAALKQAYPKANLEAILLGEEETPTLAVKSIRKTQFGEKFIKPPEYKKDKRFAEYMGVVAEHEAAQRRAGYTPLPYREWVKKKRADAQRQLEAAQQNAAEQAPATLFPDSAIPEGQGRGVLRQSASAPAETSASAVDFDFTNVKP